jgi:hypothetical protein
MQRERFKAALAEQRRGRLMSLRIDQWHGPTKKHDYWEWSLDGQNDNGRLVYGKAIVFADSTDEHGDQNVNWEVARDGSPVARGHTRNVRQAQQAAQSALTGALR